MGFEVTKVYEFFDFEFFEKRIPKKYPARSGIFHWVILQIFIDCLAFGDQLFSHSRQASMVSKGTTPLQPPHVNSLHFCSSLSK